MNNRVSKKAKKNAESTTSVKILKRSQAFLNAISDERGMGKIELVSRLAEWVYHQDKTLQAIILGQVEKADELQILDLIRNRLKSENKTVYPPGTKVNYVLMSAEEQQLVNDIRASHGPTPEEQAAAARIVRNALAHSPKTRKIH